MGDSAMSVMLKHVNEEPLDLRLIVPEAPAALMRVVERALAKDRAHRFATASAMAEALRQAASAYVPARIEAKAARLGQSGTAAATVVVDAPAGTVASPLSGATRPVAAPVAAAPIETAGPPAPSAAVVAHRSALAQP
jgi:hypothetical protein